MKEGASSKVCLEGESVSLVCGYGLDSYPPAVVTWTNPNGNSVQVDERITAKMGRDSVELEISNASLSDSGTWRCAVEVKDSCVHKVVDGKLEQHCDANFVRVGLIEFDVNLKVVGK